jgi:nucleotide-binding universal stress UspA family protein
MYEKILLALDLSPADRPIIDHIKKLAAILHSRIVLLHVATGAAAQFHEEDAGGKEVKESRNYLKQIRGELEAAGIEAEAEMAFGEPGKEIIKYVDQKGCDLVAMGTHGHKLIGDLFLGATASRVQHNISVPVLLLRAK